MRAVDEEKWRALAGGAISSRDGAKKLCWVKPPASSLKTVHHPVNQTSGPMQTGGDEGEYPLRVYREICLTFVALDALRSTTSEEVKSTAGMPLHALVALAQTHPYAEEAHYELDFRVKQTFEEWYLDGNATLLMLDSTDSVMSGSAALKICDPMSWMPGDLDFYCPLGRLQQVRTFFSNLQYTRTDTPNMSAQDPLYTSKTLIHTVVIMEKDGKHINIIESSVPSAIAPIFAFHSTLLMNVVTARGVLCFYPSMTLLGFGK